MQASTKANPAATRSEMDQFFTHLAIGSFTERFDLPPYNFSDG